MAMSIQGLVAKVTLDTVLCQRPCCLQEVASDLDILLGAVQPYDHGQQKT